MAFLRSQTNDASLEVFFRDILPNACSSMPNGLRYARKDAAMLRAKADEIESRAISKLTEDVIADWKPEEIYASIDKMEAGK